MAEVIT